MPIGLDSAFDLFRKVERDRAAVERDVTPDALFNFVVTAHSLTDWVQKDPTILPAAEEACASLAKTNDWLRACRDLANGSKHFAIDRYEPLVEHADAVSGYGVGRYGVGAYGQGEWRITVSWGGTTHDALAFVAEVTKVWTDFFREHAPAKGGAA
jgi:hypothetical protein